MPSPAASLGRAEGERKTPCSAATVLGGCSVAVRMSLSHDWGWRLRAPKLWSTKAPWPYRLPSTAPSADPCSILHRSDKPSCWSSCRGSNWTVGLWQLWLTRHNKDVRGPHPTSQTTSTEAQPGALPLRPGQASLMKCAWPAPGKLSGTGVIKVRK